MRYNDMLGGGHRPEEESGVTRTLFSFSIWIFISFYILLAVLSYYFWGTTGLKVYGALFVLRLLYRIY